MLTASLITESVVAHRASILHDSVLASSFDAHELSSLERQGEVLELASGAVVFERGAPSDHLYVVLDGAVLPVMAPGGAPAFWVGPGDVCGEMGFALGTPRRTTMMAFGPAPRLWRVHREVIARASSEGTRLLMAIARVAFARLEQPALDPSSSEDADYCNHGHPSVVALAHKLARPTQLETACAIWDAIWKMPYRFGTWQWTASETVERGHGMCTTKAILQISLMRALGIECGYVKGVLDGPLVRACMPPVYHPRFQRPTFKHYYAAAKIDGRWIPLDGSFSLGSLSLIAETEHHVLPFATWDARVHGFANGAASLGGLDPYAIEVHAEIDDVMQKAASYDAKNANAMNVLLDRAQGFTAPLPAYAEYAQRALSHGDHPTARALLIDGLACDAEKIRALEAACGKEG
ncbi:MAG: transglutaminase domain-containing protein [Byssovorax sp.]